MMRKDEIPKGESRHGQEKRAGTLGLRGRKTLSKVTYGGLTRTRWSGSEGKKALEGMVSNATVRECVDTKEAGGFRTGGCSLDNDVLQSPTAGG